MPRALTVTRRSVPRDRADAYHAACRAEADRLSAVGDHLWLFRRSGEPGSYLEFREGSDPGRLAASDPEAPLWLEVDLTRET